MSASNIPTLAFPLASRFATARACEVIKISKILGCSDIGLLLGLLPVQNFSRKQDQDGQLLSWSSVAKCSYMKFSSGVHVHSNF